MGVKYAPILVLETNGQKIQGEEYKLPSYL